MQHHQQLNKMKQTKKYNSNKHIFLGPPLSVSLLPQ